MKNKRNLTIIFIVVIVLLFVAYKSYIEFNSLEDKELAGESLRSYHSWVDFPFATMEFLDDEKTFEVLKKAYEKVEFFGEFKEGDLSLYDEYKGKFREYVIENNYINENLESRDYYYYFFDMDDDGTPELSIYYNASLAYIVKYVKEKDEFVLLFDNPYSYYHLLSTKKIIWDRMWINVALYDLDREKYNEADVSFFAKGNYPGDGEDDYDGVYVLGMPKYGEGAKGIKITKNIREQAYIDENHGTLYFRVTKEQYHELTDEFMVAHEIAFEKIEDFRLDYMEFVGVFAEE